MLAEKLRIVPQCPLSRKLGAFMALSESELAALAGFQRHPRALESKEELVHEGQVGHTAFILLEGWMCSYKMLKDGTRQIVDFQVPGDFLGLRSLLFRTSDHNIEAATPALVSHVTAAEMFRAFSTTPRLAAAALWSASSDEAMVVERLVSLGRRDAIERTAHFFLELGARLKLVGLANEQGFDCPLTQYHLADALGLSAIHINRVLRILRDDGLLTFRNGRVTFDDVERLIDLSGFDAEYLDYVGPMLS
jgi:CRP-like cAMP-binding protein